MSESVDAKPNHRWLIPNTWSWTVTSEIAQIIGGGTPSTRDAQNFDGGEIPWITPADLTGYREKMIRRGDRNITEKGLRESGARVMPAGTVLFSSRAPIGYVAIADNPVATNQGFKSFIPSQAITSDFLYYYMQFAKPIAKELASGTTFLEISGAKAAQIPIPVAPLREQQEIIAEIEKQFTRLDAATAALKRVQANLKRYRASVLKAACEGRLVPTEAELARNEGRAYEPAEKLLQRILRERRARWEADTLAKMQASGKPPKDNHWKQKYKEPSAPDTSNLPPLPEGWCWASLETSAFVTKLAGFEYTNFVKYDPDGDLRVLKAENASPRGFKPTAYSRVRSETVSHLNRSKIRGNDVLMVFVGAGLGQVARVPADGEYFLGPNIALIRVDEASCDPGFIEYYLRSPLGFRLANNRAKATAQGSISMAEIRLITCPIPPLSERMRIVIEIERILSITDSIEQQLAALVLRSDRLRHSVLSSAFTGQLVPQDPTDEPASALLERIRAGRVESSRKAVARKAVKKRGKR